MIKLFTLNNGLRVVMEPTQIPIVRSISLGVWVHCGSRNETSKENGLSHFVHHMLFKGTEKRTCKQIAEDMDAIGGVMNGYVSKEYTCYYARTMDAHFDTMLDVISDIFLNSKFEDDSANNVRSVILEQLSMHEDMPEDLVHDMLQNQIWANDFLGQNVMGCPDTIASFNCDDMRRYMRQHYRPNNTVIAVAGNINELQILEKITKAFGSFESIASKSRNPRLDVEYNHAFAIREKKHLEQKHLCVGFPGVASESSDIYTVAMVNTILGGSMSSRLFRSIREELGAVYSIYSYNASFVGAGLFTIYAGFGASSSVLDILTLINAEIRGLISNKITPDLLMRTKEQFKCNYLMSLDSVDSRMNSIGRRMLLHNKITTSDEILNEISNVDLDMFYAVCDKIFNVDQISIALVGRNLNELNKNDLLLS